MKLQGKVAIVTGAASGIGRASAILFAKEGAMVAVVDVDTQGGAKTVEKITAQGNIAFFVKADVSRNADVRQMVEETVARWEEWTSSSTTQAWCW